MRRDPTRRKRAHFSVCVWSGPRTQKTSNILIPIAHFCPAPYGDKFALLTDFGLGTMLLKAGRSHARKPPFGARGQRTALNEVKSRYLWPIRAPRKHCEKVHSVATLCTTFEGLVAPTPTSVFVKTCKKSLLRGGRVQRPLCRARSSRDLTFLTVKSGQLHASSWGGIGGHSHRQKSVRFRACLYPQLGLFVTDLRLTLSDALPTLCAFPGNWPKNRAKGRRN